MVKFKYNGDAPEVSSQGYTFTGGKAVDVTNDAAIAFFEANSHFDVAKGRKPKEEPAEEVADDQEQ